jgi:hypothetical protein
MGNASAADLILFQIPYGRHSFDYYVQQQATVHPRKWQEPTDNSVSLAQGISRALVPFVAAGEGQAAYRWAEGLYTNAGMDPSTVDRRMAGVVSGSRVVWLVATETELWDERGLVQGWLADQADLADTAHFLRVSVYRYELP